MKTLNIQVTRENNTTSGNPVFTIDRWDNNQLLNALIESKAFKTFKNKKHGSGVKTKPNAGYVYALLNKDGVEVDGILIKATLFNN